MKLSLIDGRLVVKCCDNGGENVLFSPEGPEGQLDIGQSSIGVVLF